MDLDLELANFGVKLCNSMAANCVVIALSPVVCAGLWVKKKSNPPKVVRSELEASVTGL